MTRVTRDIDPSEARDLLERVPRACLAFVRDDAARAEPVTVLWKDERYLVGMPSTAPRRPAVGDEVVLLIDEGVHFFDLRAIYIRGRATPTGELPERSSERFWFAVEPTRIVAWDYGRMRETRES